MRRMELTPQESSNSGYKVVSSSQGSPHTESKLKAILSHTRVSFYIGDSKGVPENILNQADEIISVSGLKSPHQLEAAILTDSLEQALINSNACRV